MYNQVLIPSPLSPLLFNSSSSSALSFSSPRSAAAAPFAPLSHLHCFQVVEKGPGMEALRSSLRSEMVSSPQQQNQEVVVWERAGLHGEAFSVDELLNLGEFVENDKESEENETEAEEVSGEQEGEQMTTVEDCCKANAASSSPPSSSSALSYGGSRPLSEITLPAHDAEEFEWVSLFMDDSLTEFPTGVAPWASPPQAQNWSDNGQQHHGAVVVPAHVASLPCATVCAVSSEAPVPPKAKRSKRSRIIGIGWSTALPFTDFSSTTTTTTSASSCSSSSSSSLSPCLIYDQSPATGEQSFLLYESHPSLPPSPPPHPASKKTNLPKKRGRKPKQPPAAAGSVAASLHGERRCSHCGAQKTPQWRAGPKGAKTLCNACGVRYKSGRLLPEYRPACSPTYVDSIHSSSHRKVLELRRQKESELLVHAIGPQPVATC